MLQLNGRSLTQRFPRIQIVNILLISMNNWSEVINEVELVTFHNTLKFIEFLQQESTIHSQTWTRNENA